jgi:hypothetical protein
MISELSRRLSRKTARKSMIATSLTGILGHKPSTKRPHENIQYETQAGKMVDASNSIV